MSYYSENLKFNDKYSQYILDSTKYKYNILEGSVRSSKTVFNCLAFALYIESYDTEKELLFLAAAFDESLAKALLGECNGFGLAYYFDKSAEYKQYKNADALKITIHRNGKRLIRWVIFAGAGKENSYKSIRGLSLEGVLCTEANLFNPEFLEEARKRQFAAINPKFFIDMNPSQEGHWIYTNYIDNPRLDLNYLHATLIDNPSLSQDRINQIKSEYDPDSIQYKAAILGQRINLEGMIYNIRDYNILESFNPSDYISYITVADPGENMSGSAYALIALYYNDSQGQYELHVLKTYWHRNADSINKNHPKLPKEYAQDYIMFIRECINLMGKIPSQCILDEDITFFREIQQVENNPMPLSAFKYPYKEDVDSRIKTGTNLLYRGKLRFYKDNIECIKQWRNAVYDPTQKLKGKFIRQDKPEVSNIDFLDAIEYSFPYYSKYLY